ncbi:hypothetical protein AHAS_Ahas16G0237800 [Arachis hypogaea]
MMDFGEKLNDVNSLGILSIRQRYAKKKICPSLWNFVDFDNALAWLLHQGYSPDEFFGYYRSIKWATFLNEQISLSSLGF